ncbi:26.2 kDa heat shock protein, mitochondrial-like [Triticum aestivum]|uniref:26.2 kDa heat shock protein, mitochondrial-like n=1 Tax=Triticum aestivum TaxID=4565 RepID=UPI001D00D333|nr:26.2 kDa heat shock protein, mitochondrial-like [Triticum aestivum]
MVHGRARARESVPRRRLALRLPSVTAARRPYNTQVKEVGRYDNDDYSGRDLVIPSLFSQDVLDPHSAPTSMARLLSLMETGLSSIAVASRLGRWVAKDDDNAGADVVQRQLRASDDIRGCCDKALQILCAHYGWETVEVTVPEVEEMRLAHYVTMGSECSASLATKEHPDDQGRGREAALGRAEVQPPHGDACWINKIKAEIKNGVLWVTLLKVEEEERKSVFHVKVE